MTKQVHISYSTNPDNFVSAVLEMQNVINERLAQGYTLHGQMTHTVQHTIFGAVAHYMTQIMVKEQT